MHLLVRETHGLDEAAAAVDLDQSPADLVVLSFTDSDLAAVASIGDALPSLRLASLAHLAHPLSVDLYVEKVIARAKTVVIRLLGGLDYWRYGAEQAHAAACRHGVRLAIIPGDDRADPRLTSVSTLEPASLDVIWRCFAVGGGHNIAEALAFAAGQRGSAPVIEEQPRHGILREFPALASGPRAVIVFYRAFKLSNDLAPICALEGALLKRGFGVTAIYLASTKEPDCVAFLENQLRRIQPHIIINTTAFSARRDDGSSPFDAAGCVVLQVIISNGHHEGWAKSSRGLSATDIAMNVVMPELDGRLGTRAIAFKETLEPDPRFEFSGRRAVPVADRVAFVADQAAALARLSMKPNASKRLAVILNDYPGAAGRAGHAVGLDGPQSAINLLRHLAQAGYEVEPPKDDPTSLMLQLEQADDTATLRLDDYARWFDGLPQELRDAVIAAHGAPSRDADVRGSAFEFRIIRCGGALLCLQPHRGRAVSHRSDYHDQTQPPRHGFLAFYWWLRRFAKVDAIVHLGAHGSLEWLPGKSSALSASCWPEIALGPTPMIYPFIISDPGEAAQAKRRLSAVTIGHLTPPLVEAGIHGPASEIEALMEEYATAAEIDGNRARLLAAEIMDRACACGLTDEAGETLTELDAWLCDLKEMRIKDGLHVLGSRLDPDVVDEQAAAVAKTAGSDAGKVAALMSASPDAEMDAIIDALAGGFVRPGPSGAPSRGRIDCLPTGRNMTTLDPRQSPTRTAEHLGRRAADEVLKRHLQDHGDWPRSIVIDAWGSAAIRTGGDELAQAFALMGVRLLRETGSERITGFEIMALAELGRPRIDITLKISGLYRDLFAHQISLFDQAVRALAARDEPVEDNPLAASMRGVSAAEAGTRLLRIFGPAPERYGTGLEPLVLSGHFETEAELGADYLAESAYAYGVSAHGDRQPAALAERVRGADAHLRSHDLSEQDILDAPDYAYATGGFLAASRSLGGDAASYHLDTTHAGAPRVRGLGEEIARVVRGRMTNPRWIAGQMRHGWRGAAELAQSVDSLFAFAATTGLVKEHQFDLVFSAYLDDPAVDRFLREANPAAHGAIEARLAEAIRRRLWQPRRNSVGERLVAHLSVPEAAE
ncbi:MAG: cobaltochelatase subunit CobN [Beijerinckiaceae bacterium]|nr:cobaltochelatase subunit CobN [Beijerinckiaceae bacterium]